MVNATEFRPGNYLMQKVQQKIKTVACRTEQIELLLRNETRDLYPLVLKAVLLEKAGFVENTKYPLLPEAHEWILLLPVPGEHATEIRAYVKNNQECFARLVVNGLAASQPLYHFHQLQNLYFSLTGKELPVQL